MAMVTLRLNNFEPSYSLDWVYTNWEVSTAKNFDRSTLVASSYEDRNNKHSIFFDIPLEPGKKYYARAQIVSSKGAHKWTNLHTWTHKGYDDIDNIRDMPSAIASPDHVTDSNPQLHIPTGFTIKGKDFACVGDAVHTSTSYWIEDLDGKVVWKNLNNEIMLNNILVDDIILNDGNVYRIKMCYHSSSDDISPISTFTIFVGGTSTDVNLLKVKGSITKKNIALGSNIPVLLYKKEKAKTFSLKVLGYKDKSSYIVVDVSTDLTTTEPKLIIPVGSLRDNEVYVLLGKYDNEDYWRHIITNTYS